MPGLVSRRIDTRIRRDNKIKQHLADPNKKFKLQKIRIDDSDTFLYGYTTTNVRPYIPEVLRRKIFNIVYNLAHPSGRSTKKLIAKSFM